MPMVGWWVLSKVLYMNWFIMEVFPTDRSPKNTILYLEAGELPRLFWSGSMLI